MTLEALIALCREAKAGNNDFALFSVGGQWQAAIGNNTPVMLGEAEGEYVSGWQETPTAAVASVLRAVDPIGYAELVKGMLVQFEAGRFNGHVTIEPFKGRGET